MVLARSLETIAQHSTVLALTLRTIFAKPTAAAIFLTINGLILLAGERLRRRAEVRKLVLTHIPLPDDGKWAIQEAKTAYDGPIEIAETLKSYEI